jgi:putative tricarboxylic transport membrane protein
MAEKTNHQAQKSVEKREIAGGLIWLFFAVLVIISSVKLGVGEFHNPGPGFFPFWSALLLGLLALLMLANIILKKEKAQMGQNAHLWKGLNWGKNITVIAALFAYCLVLTRLGYILSTLGLMIVLFYIGKMKLWAVIASALLAVGLSYGLFYYGLQTPLPSGILGF